MTPEAEKNQYNEICKGEFAEIKESIGNLHTDFKEFYKAFYVGNGKESYAVRADRVERFMKLTCWTGGVMFVSWVGIIGKFVYDHLAK